MFEAYITCMVINLIVLVLTIVWYEIKKYNYHATTIQMLIVWGIVSFIPFVNFLTAFASMVFLVVTGGGELLDSLSGISWKLANKLNGRKSRQ